MKPHPALPRITEHPLKQTILNQVPLSQVARFIGKSYSNTSQILSGTIPATDKTENKLAELAELIGAGGGHDA